MAREEMAWRATSSLGRLIGRVALSLLLFFVVPAGMVAAAGVVDHGDIHVHDPMMLKQGRTYYVFSTGGGIQIRTSPDLVRWRFTGTVFATIPSWVTDAVGPISDLWAPDVSYFNGLYHLYYAGSQFGMNTSVIGLATNTTLDPSSPRYHWIDRGLVIQSTASHDFNAIDPSVVVDTTHVPWLVFGSFWSGIKLRRLDARTGKLSTADTPLYSLAARPAPDAIEAPYIVHRGHYYYLFVSFDFCCRGAQSTYRIMVGRARRVTGPYVDDHGRPMLEGAARQVLASYGRYRGPGGQSIFVDGPTHWLVYHYYDALDNGTSKLQIRPLRWTKDGWPLPGPLQVSP
jgi:arabinan endo-1,5-alpha-L-arabinosidase